MATLTQDSRGGKAGTRRQPGPWLRLGISLLLVGHLAAVFAPPYRFASAGPRGAAPTADAMMTWLRPYIDFAYLDHGYFFFAPNPGASHLMEATIEMPDGKQLVRRFPDRGQHWPRLLYHRHFMLAEWLNAGFAPPQPPRELLDDPMALESWQQQRRIYELVRQSYKQHLVAEYNAEYVELDRLEHRPPELGEFRDLGWKLSDKRLYSVMPEEGRPAEFGPGMPRPTGPLVEEIVPGGGP